MNSHQICITVGARTLFITSDLDLHIQGHDLDLQGYDLARGLCPALQSYFDIPVPEIAFKKEVVVVASMDRREVYLECANSRSECSSSVD